MVRKESALKRNAKKRLYFYLFAAPGLIGFVILSVYPVIYSFILSFTNRRLLYPGTEKFIFLDNYIYLFTKDPDFWDSFGNSMLYAASTVLLTNFIAILMAVLLSKQMRGRSVFRTIFYIPSILPSVATIIMFGFIFDVNNGVINNVLLMLGVPRNELPLWLTHSQSALPTLIIMSCWAFGGKAIIYLAGINGISKSLYEAASIDGARPVRVFFSITLPLLTPSIFYNLIMSSIGGIQVFNEGLIATGNVKQFYVVKLYRMAYINQPYLLGRASAMAWALFLVIMIFTALNFFVSKYYVRYGE